MPNSRMSAPAMKFLPAPTSRMARTLGSVCAAWMASAKSRRTSALSALTGGWSRVMTRMSSSRRAWAAPAVLLSVMGPCLRWGVRRCGAWQAEGWRV
ncbi:hypothetical protein D3C87_1324990 [compost metagenome]